jgi:hypothetical protein
VLSVALNGTALFTSQEVNSDLACFFLVCLSFTGEGGLYNHIPVPQVLIFIPVGIRAGTDTRGDEIG